MPSPNEVYRPIRIKTSLLQFKTGLIEQIDPFLYILLYGFQDSDFSKIDTNFLNSIFHAEIEDDPTCVPVKESFSPEHGSELFRNSLEQLLDGGGISNESGSHLETTWRNITNSNLDVVWDPFHKVGGVLVLDVQHLLVHFLHRHPSPEDGRNGEIAAMSWVAGSHHVLRVKHLLGQLWHRQGSDGNVGQEERYFAAELQLT